MSEKKSKLTLKLPSHHLYDQDDSQLGNFQDSPVPLQRRKNSKSFCVSGDKEASNFLAMPDTPPTPNGSASLYPFLRLHRQLSSSVPDVPGEHTNQSVISNEERNQTSFGYIGKVKTISSGMNLSQTIVEHGFTVVANSMDSSGYHSDNDSSSQSPFHNIIEMNSKERSIPMLKRGSSGFLSSLIFGNQPMHVSPFDVNMCAPSSM